VFAKRLADEYSDSLEVSQEPRSGDANQGLRVALARLSGRRIGIPLQNVGGVITHNTTASSSPGFPYLCGSWLEKLKLSPSLS